MKAVSAAQMQQIELRSVEAGVSLDDLMENAGLAVANSVGDYLGRVYGSRITVLAGPGNNGSDGLVAARHLASRGARVTAFAVSRRPEPDPTRNLAESAGVSFNSVDANGSGLAILKTALAHSDLVVDAVLGTGRARPIEEPLAGILQTAAEASCRVIAVDLPTGIDADSGKFDPHGLRADLTLMLGLPKLGPLVEAGNGACGEIRVLDIGIPDGLADDVTAELLTPGLARTLLPGRAPDANKGSFGKALVIGGSMNYVGAPLLATRAAVRSGAGLVFVATPEPVYRLIAGRVEDAIYLSLAASENGDIAVRDAVRDVIDRVTEMSSVLIGPGLGQSPATVQFVEQLVRSLPKNVPVIVDADALNILSRAPGWSDGIEAPLVLTPHPGEMARLLRSSVSEVQADRPAAAKEAAKRFHANVVLKGAATLVATPSGMLRISPWVNPGLAKGGTGDVLAGLIAGLLAQSPGAPFDAAALAVYLHGLAGEHVRTTIGERGMTASDVAAALPEAFRHLEFPGSARTNRD